MVRYVGSGLSIRRCAVMMAQENKVMNESVEKIPGIRHFRNGPYGSTNAETLERQIKREKKRMADDPNYRKFVEVEVASMRRLRGEQKKRDIS